MKRKCFDFKYYIPYVNAERPVAPYNIVVIGNEIGRLFFSYKRPIYDYKQSTRKIGEANYLIHMHTLNIDSNGRNGTLRGDFTATHSFLRKDNEYDLTFTGQLEWVLGVRLGQTTIDSTNPQNHVVGVNEIDHISANCVFKNRKKINHGNNIATLKNGGEYRVRGVVEKYNF